MAQSSSSQPVPETNKTATDESLPNSDLGASEKQETTNIEVRPNGGFFAWLQVACSFFLYFNTFGLITSYGIFQTYYESVLKYGASQASIIGSLQNFLIFFSSAVSGPLYDAGYCRAIVTIGSTLLVLGIMMQSLCKEYWQFILAQSLSIGIGGGIVAFLGPQVLSTHFSTKYPLASGIGAAGGGVAGIIFPIAFRQLLPRVGFSWTVRVIGFIALGTLLLPVIALRPRQKPAAKRKTIDKTAFHDVPFLVFLVGNFVMLLGMFAPFVYIQIFAIEKKLASRDLSFYIISIMNFSSVLGRIIPNFLSIYIGPFNVFILSVVVTFVDALAMIAVKDVAGLIMTAIVFGFSTGCIFALQPVVLIKLCPDPKMIGTRVGMGFGFLGLAILPSTPIAGALKGRGAFEAAWAWAGVTSAVGAIIMVVARGIKTNWRLFAKI